MLFFGYLLAVYTLLDTFYSNTPFASTPFGAFRVSLVAPRKLLEISGDGRAGAGMIDMLGCIFEQAKQGLVEPGEAQRQSGEPMPPAVAKVMSKVLFAMRQLCADADSLKAKVGQLVIKDVLMDLALPKNLEHRDWAVNAIFLVRLLSRDHQVQASNNQ